MLRLNGTVSEDVRDVQEQDIKRMMLRDDDRCKAIFHVTNDFILCPTARLSTALIFGLCKHFIAMSVYWESLLNRLCSKCHCHEV